MLARHDEHPVEVCALAVDLDTGEVLLSRAARRLCRPASTMKLLTTSAICRRDVDRAFRTRVVCDGEATGQITLVGDGDPFLSTADLRRMASTLAAQGVEEVMGPVVVLDPLRDAPRWGEGWMWDDEPSTFQPLFSGAVVDRGCVTVAIQGSGDELQAALRPVQGELELMLAIQHLEGKREVLLRLLGPAHSPYGSSKPKNGRGSTDFSSLEEELESVRYEVELLEAQALGATVREIPSSS